MQALSGSGREGIQLCTLVGRSPLSPDCILTKQRFRMFVYRVLCLEGNGRIFKISTNILENTRFVTLARPLTLTDSFKWRTFGISFVFLSSKTEQRKIYLYIWLGNPYSPSPSPDLAFIFNLLVLLLVMFGCIV